jgi:general stress protein 26
METKNLAEAEGLPPIEWSRVDTEIARRLGDWDPGASDRPTCWLTTINADGSPHVTSVGALWHAGSFWFQTGERTRKARNVARNAHCSMSVATRGLDVVVEGEAHRTTDPALVSEAA